MHISDLCFSYHPTFAVAVFISAFTCSVELPAGGVHAMNIIIPTKWGIALSIYIGVLDNH